MEKHELSYSDCRIFIKYISKAIDSLFHHNFKAISENIDSAKDMLFDWRCDDEIGLRDDEWLTCLLSEVTAAYEMDDWASLFEGLCCIRDEVKKMMQRLGIKQDTNGC